MSTGCSWAGSPWPTAGNAQTAGPRARASSTQLSVAHLLKPSLVLGSFENSRNCSGGAGLPTGMSGTAAGVT